jgi:hypothetical protein
VRGGFGEFMLKKMGWEEGEGIGKHKQGDANPLTLEIKFDKKGLMAAEEEKRGSVSIQIFFLPVFAIESPKMIK